MIDLDPSTVSIVAALSVALGSLWLALRGLLARSRPDEWLLQVRDGALVRGGIGISVVRWPQDRIVRFPASVQRVRFEAEALTQELLPVKISAFALWSVLPNDPLLAVRRLGLSGSSEGPHLLSRPQHHAFQQAFAALVRRHAGAFELAALCRDPAPLADAVLTDAVHDLAGLGAQVEGVQIIEARPAEALLLERLSAPVDEALAREAARARDATEREQQRLALATQQEGTLARIASEIAVDEERSRLHALHHERAVAELEAELELARRRAEGTAAVARIQGAVDEAKSPEVRAHELARLRTEALSETLRAWPIQEARWVGLEGPVQAVGRILGLGSPPEA